jgi:hypothetical protein
LATKILLRSATGIGTSETAVGAKVQPTSGIKWTLTEIRPYASAAGTIRIYFDTELYYEIHTSVTPAAYPKPHVVAIDVVTPHYIQVNAKADSGTINVKVELVVEESPAA